MAPSLRVRLNGRDHRFAGSQDVKFGRAPDADIRSTNERVSRKHAVLRPDGPNWILEDVGSLHGTFVAGEKISSFIISGPGSVIVWLAEPGQGQVLQILPEGTTSRSGIFISYRRDDASGHAGRLYDRLRAHFGSNEIFRDIDNIGPGDDFVARVEQAVGSCQVLLAVIGRNWAGATPGSDQRRIDEPDDWVRLEVAAALTRGVRIIPVLVQNASTPDSNELPGPLKPLARRQALGLDDDRWEFDCSRLIKAIEASVGAPRHRAVRWEPAARNAPPDDQDVSTAGREEQAGPSREPGRPDAGAAASRPEPPPTPPPAPQDRIPRTPPPKPAEEPAPPPQPQRVKVPPPWQQPPPPGRPWGQLGPARPVPPPDAGPASISAGWWLLAVFVPLFGGLIAWASVRDRDPRLAKSMLITNIVLSGPMLILYLLFVG